MRESEAVLQLKHGVNSLSKLVKLRDISKIKQSDTRGVLASSKARTARRVQTSHAITKRIRAGKLFAALVRLDSLTSSEPNCTHAAEISR